jgi:hypothetical protein
MRNFVAACLVVLVASSSVAQVPSFVTWSGRLTDGTASEATATLALTVSLWDAEAGGKRIWQASFPAVVVENGYFSVVLGPGVDPATGAARNVTDVFAANGSTWVTVAVADGLDLAPRQAVGSVPYCVNASTLGGVVTVSDGKAGIGTTPPLHARLDITGASSYKGADPYASADTMVNLDNRDETSGNIAGILWRGVSLYWGGIFLRYLDRTKVRSQLEFATRDGASNFGTRLTIAPGGNVGIGTTQPNEALDVAAGNIRLGRPDSGARQGMVIMGGGVAKPGCTAETQGAITYEQSGGVNNGHFFGCRGLGGGSFSWVQLD